MRRARAGLLGLMALVGLTACGSGSGSDRAAPRWPGVAGELTVHTGDACRRVLVVGDSIAHGMAPFLEAALEDTGRCATVVDRSVPGSSLGDLQGRIDSLVAAAEPDVVVVHHIGNQGEAGPFWSDPTYVATAAAAATWITDRATAAGASVHWAVPPVGAWNCRWDSLNAQRWREWAEWVQDSLPETRAVGLVDWRTPFGGDEYSEEFAISGEVERLRLPDCVHLSKAGSRIAADATVIALQDEWVRA